MIIVTTIRVMYWKEIPVQVEATDDKKKISKPLEGRFQQGVDAISMFDGSSGTDEYLDAWQWVYYCDIEGDADTSAEKVADKFNEDFPADFVSRIRDLHLSGSRNPTPGAVDHWIID